MKKQIKIVDEKKGTFQITTTDERWYAIQSQDSETKLPIYRFIPSVTWICEFYPKGIAFYKWLADKGWDEAEAIKSAAGDKGSKIHKAIEGWLAGEEIRMDSKITNPTTEQLEELTSEEYEAIKSFIDWWATINPKLISSEQVVISEKLGFAGTIDLIIEINKEKFLVDIKSSQYVWPEHELQISAYKNAVMEYTPEYKDLKLAILQVGYKKNKAGWKWNEVEDKFALFMAARQIWASETEGDAPKQKDFPIVLPTLKALNQPETKVVESKKLKS